MEISITIDEKDAHTMMKNLNMSRKEFENAFRKFVELEFTAFVKSINEKMAKEIDREGKASAWKKLKEKYLQ